MIDIMHIIIYFYVHFPAALEVHCKLRKLIADHCHRVINVCVCCGMSRA